jgi:hypothetical protein
MADGLDENDSWRRRRVSPSGNRQQGREAPVIDPPSPGAKRMREYRRRRRYGLLSIRVRVARVLIDALIEKSYLKPEHHDDRNEIAIAVGDLITDSLQNT